MKHITTIKNKDTTLEFDISASGVNLKKGKVVFSVDSEKDIYTTINCTYLKGQTWSITIPANTFNAGNHNFILAAIIDSYFLIFHTGSLDVVDGENIKLTTKVVESLLKEDSKPSDDDNDQLIRTHHQEYEHETNKQSDADEDTHTHRELVEEFIVTENKKQPIFNVPSVIMPPTGAKKDFKFFNYTHPPTPKIINVEVNKKIQDVIKHLKKP